MDDEQPDVASLLARTRQRDAAAAEALVEYLHPVVMPVVQRRLPRGADPQDLAQEVFLKIFTNLDGFRGPAASLEAWARRIAFRTCLNQLRHQRSRPELRRADLSETQLEMLDSVTGAGSEPDPAQQTSARDLIETLLARLPAKERALFELLELEQRSLDEVRQLTGWSHINIRVRMHRARQKLRHAWRCLLHDHERP
jgi:RNA polymerase sigma-70 factor (ECF subfamily)